LPKKADSKARPGWVWLPIKVGFGTELTCPLFAALRTQAFEVGDDQFGISSSICRVWIRCVGNESGGWGTTEVERVVAPAAKLVQASAANYVAIGPSG